MMNSKSFAAAFLHPQPLHFLTSRRSRAVSKPRKPCNLCSKNLQASSPRIPETPCFTPSILSAPMPPSHRTVYLNDVAQAAHRFLSHLSDSASDATATQTVAQITLLPPQLNPELDVYDRRFLLQLVWAVLDVTANSYALRTRVLIQGTGSFGAIPLSVAGLRRNFDADVAKSADAWIPGIIQSGDLEKEADLTEEDQVVIVVSPTNTVSAPVVNDVANLVERAAGRPVFIINPRLADVPSSGGVMQVTGRAERRQFLQSFSSVFYLRLLFTSGTMYPLRGILYQSFPNPWQVWRSEDGTSRYRLIASTASNPNAEQITEAFANDQYAAEKKLIQEARDSGAVSSIDDLITTPTALAVIGVLVLVAVAIVFKQDFRALSDLL